jgi:deazaflavin-dependent oxidoreductase (nitroreductase family)
MCRAVGGCVIGTTTTTGGRMSFDTPNGTRGAHQPGSGGPLGRWMTRRIVNRVRRRGGRMMGGEVLVLTTVGARSGAQRSTPVRRFPGTDGGWVVVASAAGGARNPAWYYNLAAHPDQVRVEMAGQVVPVTAHQLHGPARDEVWAAIASEAPRFAGYPETTDRELPVVQLTPRTA